MRVREWIGSGYDGIALSIYMGNIIRDGYVGLLLLKRQKKKLFEELLALFRNGDVSLIFDKKGHVRVALILNQCSLLYVSMKTSNFGWCV